MKNIFIICTKHLYSIKDIIALTAYVIVDFLSLSRNLMYFSGSEFYNKLSAMSGMFKMKKLVSKER